MAKKLRLPIAVLQPINMNKIELVVADEVVDEPGKSTSTVLKMDTAYQG